MNSNQPSEAPTPPEPEAAEIFEVFMLLSDQTELLWSVHHAATEPPGNVNEKADLANFVLVHALHIHEVAKTALVLMQNERHYAVTLLARSALESAFNMVAAMEDRQFGPQRIAFELEELARKLKLLLENGAWFASRRPTPEDCLREADRIRHDYSAPIPSLPGDRKRIEKIEEIARTAGLSPFYDDDYRLLSLAVHSNQAGILNSASGFLVRKGMLALCNATFLASQVLTGAFSIKAYDSTLSNHHARMETLMRKTDFFPRPPEHLGGSSSGEGESSERNGTQ